MAKPSKVKFSPLVAHPETGELGIENTTNVSVNPWSRLDNNMSLEVSKIKEFGFPAQLFWFLIGQSDHENRIDLTPPQIAELMETHTNNVSRGLKVLLQNDLVTKIDPHNRTFFLMLNPAVIRRCRAESVDYFQRVYNEARAAMLAREGKSEEPSATNATNRAAKGAQTRRKAKKVKQLGTARQVELEAV